VRNAYRIGAAVRECVRGDLRQVGVGALLPGGGRYPMGRVSTQQEKLSQ